VPGNIATFFAQHLARPQHILYRQFADERWRDVTASELAAQIARWQAAFRREGFAPGDRIALCVRNGLNWVAIDLAALGLGLVVVPLYVDDNADNVAWCTGTAEAKLLIVENSRLAAALRNAAVAGLSLPPLCVLRPDPDEAATRAESFLPVAGGDVEVREFADDTLATICFTSGTAGRPKGVMLSHGNIIANVRQCQATHMARADDRFLSILPLSHMFERTGGYYLPLSIGALVTYARGIAQIADDLASQRPTVMFAVPRIFDRFYARIEQALAESPLKKRMFDACVARGARVAAKQGTLADRLMLPALRALVARPILARMGGCMRFSVVGGAALDPDLARTFIGLGLPLLQGYGMTEASPVIAVNREADNDPESVGPPLPGIEVKFADNGELLARGPNVMRGYWRNEEATRAAIDAERWLHTGDLAEIRAGKIVIRGRAKDIFVMSNGEKLSPQDVELAILHDAVFEQVMLIGDGRPYVVLLAVTREADERLLVKRANARLVSFPRWARVRHVIATPEAWSVENGLLTPTLKLKRPLLVARFKERIDQAYREAPLD
jgi:long-chain acyl-CoA synthetase